MSRRAFSIPPLVVFTDRAQGVWGVAAGEEPGFLAVGRLDTDSEPVIGSGTLDATSPGEITGAWSWRGEASDFTVTAHQADTSTSDRGAGVQLGRVAGAVQLKDGSRQPLDADGVRHPGWTELAADSVRLLAAWTPPDRAVALTAVRPAGSKGHDRDPVSVVCAGERDGVSVFDPRLSSTYGPPGRLRRVGVELWLGESEDADQYSMRVAGEAAGSAARLERGQARIAAQPVQCHSRGESGVGLYLLITPR